MHRITLAPTTLPDTPPLEFIKAAVSAGFDGLGFRLHTSPAYPNAVVCIDPTAFLRAGDTPASLAGRDPLRLPTHVAWPPASAARGTV